MTTTISAIRENQYTLIKAIVPSSLAQTKFVRYRFGYPFDEWANEEDQASLRMFSILNEHDEELPHQSDGVTEEVASTMTVTIAYPKNARYGSEDWTSAMDVIREDRQKISRAIGTDGAANYLPGQNSSLTLPHEVDELEDIWLAKLQFRITFRRAIT